MREQQKFIFYDEAPIRSLVGSADGERCLALGHDSGNCPDKLAQEDGVFTQPSHYHLLEAEDRLSSIQKPDMPSAWSSDGLTRTVASRS